MKPPEGLFDREQEWADLADFVSDDSPGLALGIVYGRRRQGKSYLLRAACKSTDGLYVQALEEERVPALARFADSVATAKALPAGLLQFRDWISAFETATAPGTNGLVVVDEFPYWLMHSPEVMSVLQKLYDDARHQPNHASVKLILCGSALSVMSELLAGAKPLRGRAQLNLLLQPFNYRQARQFWKIENTELAFRMHAIFGGTPGYKDLVREPVPDGIEGLGEWLTTNVLNPSHALFYEADYLLREDPRVSDRVIYHSILMAVAEGATTPSKIGTRVGRDARSLSHPLHVLESAGFLARDEDILLQRRPMLTVADPIIRFSETIIAPRRFLYEERRPLEAWKASATTFSDQILGPHFEALARTWAQSFASQETLGEAPGEVGPAIINDPTGRTQHQIDVAVLAAGQHRQSQNSRLILLGEAKSSHKQRTIADLKRLEHIRSLLVARGVNASDAKLALFGLGGFDRALTELERRRHDIVLVDLDRLYEGD